MVALITAVALMVPAVSMTHGDLVCGMEEHAHSAKCYEQVLVCGMDEGEGADPETGEGGHVHSKACYEKHLVCDKPEHEHTDACYAPAQDDEPSDSGASKSDDAKSADEGEDLGEPAGESGNIPADSDSSADDNESIEAGSADGEPDASADAAGMPAQSFEADLKDADGNVVTTVRVEAPGGAFPAGATMKIAGVEPEQIKDAVAQGIEKDEKLKAAIGDVSALDAMTKMIAVDIAFFDADGNEIQPAKKSVVKITDEAVHAIAKPVLVRTLENKETRKAESGEVVRKVKRVNADEKDTSTGNENTLEFKAAEFSTFAIVVLNVELAEDAIADPDSDEGEGENADVDRPAASFKQDVLDENGEVALTVAVEAPEGALPAGTVMKAELVSDDAVIDAAKEAAAGKTDMTADRAQALAADIAFVDADGNEVEPAKDVRVTMTAPAVAEQDQLAVVHVDDQANATVVEGEDVSKKQEAVVFEAGEFSVYALVYTVDFTYNGFQISIPGDSSVLLSKLAKELGLDRQNADAPFDIANVESVEFTDADLLHVERIDADTTVDGLLVDMDKRGFKTWMADGVVVRTEDKSDKAVLKEAAKIDQMDNDAGIIAGDWLLTSLKAFHSDETLTITMKDGSKYVIEVRDLDTSTNGQKPGTVQGVDTVSEGITITMFDYGPDKLDNVNNTYKSTDNSGINKGHDLKFYSYGTEGSTINNFTGGAYAMQGVVRSALGDDGYPKTSTSKGESLAYLFDPQRLGNGATATSTNANYLFQRDANGNLYYDSDKNYAYLEGDNFKLYSDTYTEEGADYENPFRIGFFPYNDYDNRYRCIHGDNFRWGCKGQNDWRVRDQVGHYNHHFGMKVEGNFYMTDDKKTENDQDMVFRFSGDDDMWVFVDGVLVLDIGGIHNPVDGEINFTTGQVSVSAAKTANGGGSYALGTSTTIADAFAKAKANGLTDKDWDDSPLSQHDIKIFYMERGGMYSNLAITMNLPTFPGPKEVTLSKVDQADSEKKLAGAQFELYSDVACTKPVKQTGSDAPVIVGSVTDPLGQVKVENLIPGQTYYLKEISAPEGYKLDNRVFKIVAPANNDSSEAEIYVMNGDTPEKLTSHEITNAEDKYGSVSFMKVEQGSFTGVGGAAFTLYVDADCTQVAKSKNGTDLTATSDGNGDVDFGSQNIPAGKTYYMKETGAPEGYFPSTDVYRVVLDAEGNAKIYKGATEVSGESAITQIENQPKQQKTSVSVEKRWSDGGANHTGDTVKVQLLETVEDTNKSGGNINVTVKVNTWFEYGDESKTVAAPNNGSITYQLQKSTDGTNWTNVGSTATLSATNWSNVHEGLTEMENGQYVKYRVAQQAGDGTVVKSVDIDGNNEVSESGGAIGLKAGIAAVDTSKTKLVFIAKNVNVLPGNSLNIQIQQGAYRYRNQNGYDYGSTAWNQFSIGTENTEYSTPELDLKDGSGRDSYFSFSIQTGQVFPYSTLYMRVTPSANLVQPINGVVYGGTEIIVKGNPGQVTIEFSSMPFTGSGGNSNGFTNGFRSLLQNMRRALQATLVNGNVVATGDYYASIPNDAQPVSQSGITSTVTLNQDGNGQWAYTWSGLLDTEENVQENGYTFTRKHHYYVKEIEVNLADGTDEDFVVSNYTTEDGKVVITNTVPPKTSLSVTKEWYGPDGVTPAEDHPSITFQVRRVYGDVDEEYGNPRTISYDEIVGAYETVVVEGLPTKVKSDDGTIKDASYYVVETSPEASDNLTTYYRTSDGAQYADPADAAGKGSETIVNINSSKEITVTKQWFYQKGNTVTEATVPPEKDVYFKIKQVDVDDESFYVIGGDEEKPTSSLSDEDTPAGYDPVKSSGENGTIFHLVCTPTTTTAPSELDPDKTVSTTTWSWNTLTFSKLPTDKKYYLVETDVNGNELLSDAIGTKIEYVDENGKAIGADSLIDPNIPGSYTIKNTEHRTSLYAEKVWQGANKDNLAGNESVWFSLMRIETDGNGGYKLDTLEETPGIGRFALKESSGWTKYFDSIEVAPPERHANDQYKYWQYFIVELGLLDDSTKDKPDAEKKYRLIDNLFIKYQSKGSGTAADGSTASDREDYAVFSEGTDGLNDSSTTGNMTVQQWIAKIKESGSETKLNTLLANTKLYTWESEYNGMGTLGCFNSSEEFVNKPLKVSKAWKDANGSALSQDEMNSINAQAAVEGGDRYSVEIQLMQHAKVISEGDYANKAYDVPYGSTFMINPSEVVMQSDLFTVEKDGDALWAFKIPNVVAGENQLPAKGPFRIPGTDTTVMADFTYHVSEYSVYDNKGENVTTLWTAACKKSAGDDTYEYGLELENRKTTDLTLHKTWDTALTDANKTWVNDNVKAVLYKVWRSKVGVDAADKEDITEWVGFRPTAYGLEKANVVDAEIQEQVSDEVQGVYEDFVRVDKPAGEDGWFSNGSDPQVTIKNLDALVKDYYAEDGDLGSWPKFNYWIEEWGYVDAADAYHPISDLLHGNAASYPTYATSTGEKQPAWTEGGTAGSLDSTGKSDAVQLGAEGETHARATNTVKGTDVTVFKTDDAAQNPAQLKGATFKLTRKDANGNYAAFDYDGVKYVDAGTGQAVSVKGGSPDNGKFTVESATQGFTIKGLMPGVYKLEETAAPAGYVLEADNAIEFEVKADGTIVGTTADTQNSLPSGESFAFSDASTPDPVKKAYSLTVKNTPGKPLPLTGGLGELPFTILGSALIAGAGIYLAFRRRRIA